MPDSSQTTGQYFLPIKDEQETADAKRESLRSQVIRISAENTYHPKAQIIRPASQ
jgi:hypothetical protein